MRGSSQDGARLAAVRRSHRNPRWARADPGTLVRRRLTAVAAGSVQRPQDLGEVAGGGLADGERVHERGGASDAGTAFEDESGQPDAEGSEELPNPEHSITSIAKLLGVSPGTLYNHIPDLQELRASRIPAQFDSPF